VLALLALPCTVAFQSQSLFSGSSLAKNDAFAKSCSVSRNALRGGASETKMGVGKLNPSDLYDSFVTAQG
jgi:hypothetical protein